MSASFTLPHTGPARFIHIFINLYQFPNIYSQQIQQPQRHTHTHTHTHTHLHTSTQPPTPHAHTPTHPTLTPLTHTPTYIHYPKHPNLHPIPPQTQNTSLQHLQSFQPPPIYLLHSCTVTITLHQHINTILNIRTLIKVPFGSYRTNHHNAIRQPLS